MMAKVVIPFMERFKEPMLKGKKKWTSRTKKYGEPGDIFEAFGQIFQIDKVSQKSLSEVVEHYVDEGLTSRDEAVNVWTQLHPRKGFVPTQSVWTHEFHIVIEFHQFCECGSSVCDECNPGWELQDMNECPYLRHCPQWITKYAFDTCKNGFQGFSFRDCRTYLDQHECGSKKDCLRPKDWQNKVLFELKQKKASGKESVSK